MWLNFFSPSIQSEEERRSQIFVMAVKIKIIHIRISKIHKMSCIWNIQNTYRNFFKSIHLEKADVKYCFTESRNGIHVQYAWQWIIMGMSGSLERWTRII